MNSHRIAILLAALLPLAQGHAGSPDPRCSQYSTTRTAYYGDLHVHTRYSLDASTQGTRTSPREAYDFAQGGELGLQPWREDGSPGRVLQLDTPLDFAMVSDHAELLGEVNLCNDPQAKGFYGWQCLLYRHLPVAAYYLFNYKANIDGERLGFCGDKGQRCREAAAGPWREMIAAAGEATSPSPDCRFTAFIGYEWTGMDADTGGNLHRNVLFRNEQVPALPLSFIDFPGETELWEGLERECRGQPGSCDALVIPHNSNLSAGLMFPAPGADIVTAGYAALRARYERVLEIMQHKGSSECYFQAGSVSDELCAFEQLPTGSMMGEAPPNPDTGFARDALHRGLAIRRAVGENPYRFGFVASTDTHLGTPGAVSEAGFPGHGGAGPSARDEVPPGLPDHGYYNPGGLAAVWAEENSREAIFRALQRREVFGTSGPRISSRLFGGWTLDASLCEDADMVREAYASGVPMGGLLPARPESAPAPAFLVAASADPLAETGLQRLQIIKGWRDREGNRGERVYEVAGDAANGAGVEADTCQPTHPGAGSLCTVWRDPDFDPGADAWYYARVVQNPTCRWSQRICLANGVDCSDPSTVGPGLEACCASTHRPVIQERAWSSPIWYESH